MGFPDWPLDYVPLSIDEGNLSSGNTSQPSTQQMSYDERESERRRDHFRQLLHQAKTDNKRNIRALEETYHSLRASTRLLDRRWQSYCGELEQELRILKWQNNQGGQMHMHRSSKRERSEYVDGEADLRRPMRDIPSDRPRFGSVQQPKPQGFPAQQLEGSHASTPPKINTVPPAPAYFIQGSSQSQPQPRPTRIVDLTLDVPQPSRSSSPNWPLVVDVDCTAKSSAPRSSVSSTEGQEIPITHETLIFQPGVEGHWVPQNQNPPERPPGWRARLRKKHKSGCKIRCK